MNFDGVDAHWLWLAGAALLGITELFLPGILLVWIAVAALITGLLVMLLGLTLPFQLALFGLLAIAAVYGGRRLYEANPVASSDPLLNDRTARLVGETVTVVAAIQDGRGRVKVGDSVWAARGPDAEIGSRLVVVGSEGTCLKVQRIAPLDRTELA